MLIGGVLGYVFRAKIVGTVEHEMKKSMNSYDRRAIRDAWDTTQRTVCEYGKIKNTSFRNGM